MYDVALSVLACIRADTDVHVAWLVGSDTEAVALTPGGGRIGSLLNGAINDAITQSVAAVGDSGGVVDIHVGPAEAIIGGLTEGADLRIGIIPGSAVPESVWTSLADREPVEFAFHVTDSAIDGFETHPDTSSIDDEEWLVCTFVPTPRALIVGGGPIAAALADGFALVGWEPIAAAGPGEAGGIAPTLAPLDAVVVMGHDVEMSGRSLQAAVSSRAGYIGSVGSQDMQELRREWLAYRGASWDTRIHGPAGLPIGASNPGEIALSIVAEA
ncbi:MAG: XdhC family protein, partial [Acidimicrobiia bacterium]